jgi:hypothetical protein
MTRLSLHPVAVLRRPGRAAGGRGFTLVELLVAATLALVVMATLATLFGMFARSVSTSQDLIQLGARMRSAAWRLRQDLQGLTVEVKPWVRPEGAAGYFELVEGPAVTGTGTLVPGRMQMGDIDDVLMMTTTSPGVPFTGLVSGGVGFESQTAEVAWFCKLGTPTADGLQLYNLYRRQLLVSAVPGVGGFASGSPASNAVSFTSWNAFYESNDLSCRRVGSQLLPNSLADLTARENRFMHNPGGVVAAAAFPYVEQITTGAAASAADGEILTGARESEDFLLSNVVAFDVRVFNPTLVTTGTSYVDLPTLGSMNAKIAGKIGNPTYDTWSYHYENNGIDEDEDGVIDDGTNGRDDNNNGVVDDIDEQETSPPYTVPLRGVEIRIRCFDPTSRETRQITIQHSFLAR